MRLAIIKNGELTVHPDFNNTNQARNAHFEDHNNTWYEHFFEMMAKHKTSFPKPYMYLGKPYFGSYRMNDKLEWFVLYSRKSMEPMTVKDVQLVIEPTLQQYHTYFAKYYEQNKVRVNEETMKVSHVR